MSRSETGWAGGPRARPGEGVRPWPVVAVVVLLVVALVPSSASAGHLNDWKHDHSKLGVPKRPIGLSGLKKRFGAPCNSYANAARTWFPHAVGRGVGGYVNYHPYLARNIGYNIRTHIAAVHKDGAIDYGVYGYNCRLKTGGTGYSTHAFGAAVDTNTARNPYGQSFWNGVGSDGKNYGRYIPKVWKGKYPGHRFYWGKKFSTPDPHHFQYVKGY